MKFRNIPIVLIALLLVSACNKKSTTENKVLSIEDLLVKNNEITGWSYAGQGWVAQNISELTTYINGAAEIYQRYGFVEAAHQEFQGTIDGKSRQLRLTIYNQGNETNAKAVYDDPDLGLSGAINWQNGAGKAAHYIRFGLSQALTFYRNAYYVHLEIDYDTDESLNILKQFALNVDGKIK